MKEKVQEKQIREEKLNEDFLDLNPNEEGKYPFSVLSKEEIAEKYNFKKVKITGIFDHGNEFRIEKKWDGLNGFEICTPLITHINSKGEKCGIIVNRGWLVEDFAMNQNYYIDSPHATVTGFLYPGDPH